MVVGYMEMTKMMMTRGKQVNCQNEPSYSHHKTVVFSIRFPDFYMDEENGEVVVRKFDDD